VSHRLLILSDSHLFGSRDQKLFGVNTFQSLQKLVSHIKDSEETYDLLVASGDLSEDGHTRGYADFHESTQGLAASNVWMKGNHDQFDNVPKELARNYIHKEWHMDPWNLIFLDTTLPGKDEGGLGENELYRLEAFLKRYSDGHVFIFMHHQPMDVGSNFIDVLGLVNKQDFWELTKPYQNIRGVLFGHIHQEIDTWFNGIRLLAPPSTSMQFKPFSKDLDFDLPTHGYRNLILNPDGSFKTEVARIAADT